MAIVKMQGTINNKTMTLDTSLSMKDKYPYHNDKETSHVPHL